MKTKEYDKIYKTVLEKIQDKLNDKIKISDEELKKDLIKKKSTSIISKINKLASKKSK